MRKLRLLTLAVFISGCMWKPLPPKYPDRQAEGCTGRGSLELTDGAFCGGVPCGPVLAHRVPDAGR